MQIHTGNSCKLYIALCVQYLHFIIISDIAQPAETEFASSLSWYWQKPTTSTSSLLQWAALQYLSGTKLKPFLWLSISFKELLVSFKRQPSDNQGMQKVLSIFFLKIFLTITSRSIMLLKMSRCLCYYNLFGILHVQRILHCCSKDWIFCDIWKRQELTKSYVSTLWLWGIWGCLKLS